MSGPVLVTGMGEALQFNLFLLWNQFSVGDREPTNKIFA